MMDNVKVSSTEIKKYDITPDAKYALRDFGENIGDGFSKLGFWLGLAYVIGELIKSGVLWK